MEPGHTLPEAPPYRLSPVGFDDIIALEITEVSPDLVVLQLKEDTPEGCVGQVYKEEEDGREQVPVFSWAALQKEDCSIQWRAPGAPPMQGLSDGQIGEYCGMIVNSVAEEMYTTYTNPEACFGNLELQFYPCDICEASFTDEQELERHVSDSHFISGAKRNERRGKALSLIHKESTAAEERTFSLGSSQPERPMRKTCSTPLQCAVCGRIFKQLKSLQRHQWYHTWRQGSSNSASVEKQQPVTAGSLNYCAKCGRAFKDRKMLDKHRQIYHQNQSLVLRRGLRHSNLHKNMSPLRCCECDRYFGTKETFYRHQCFHLRKQLRAFNASGRKSKGVIFYHCQLCALPFPGGLEFERHIKVTHPEQYKKATKNKCYSGKAESRRSGALKDQGKMVSLENSEGGFPPHTVVPEERTVITEQQDSRTVQPSHPCPECGKLFMMEVLLSRHQKMYHNKTDTKLHKINQGYAHHKCTKCEKTFQTRRILQKHKRMHHKKKVFKCCECRRSFIAADTFYKHQCFHLRKQLRAFNASGKKSKGVSFFHCQLCALPFTGGFEFERHIKDTHPEQYKKATKNKCSAVMTSKKRSGALEDQGKTINLENSEGGFAPHTVVPEERTVITEQQDSRTVQSSHPCPECGKLFTMEVLLSRHQKMYHNKTDTKLHKINQGYAHHKCTKCEKTFQTRGILQKHKRMHHKKKNLKCCECDRYFGTKVTFYRHQCFHLRKQLRAFNASGRQSKGEPFFHCQLCTLQFTEGLEFEHHVKVTHPGQYKKAAKNKCYSGKTKRKRSGALKDQGKTISLENSEGGFAPITVVPEERVVITEQQDSRTVQPSHPCPECGKLFTMEVLLSRHQKLYHNKADSRFHNGNQSYAHHKSTKCEKTFRTRSILQKHKRMHHKKKDLKCCECDRYFGTKVTFYRHQCFHLRKQLRAFNASGRQSKGESFFHCQLCTLQFTDGLEFERHVKVTHPGQYKKAAKNKCYSGKAERKRSGALKDQGKTVSLENSEGGFPPITVVPEERTIITEQQDSRTVQSSHPCPECGKLFTMEVLLSRHQKMYHNKADTSLHKGNQSYSHHKSTKCEKTFRTRGILQKHRRMLHKKKDLKCCECDRYFGTKETLYRHQCFHLRKQLRAFNASGRQSDGRHFFHCQLCALQFTEGLEFDYHVKVTHPEQYKKAAKNKCSAGKATKAQESEVGNNFGKTLSNPSSVAKVHRKITGVEPKAEDQCAEICDTSSLISGAANTAEQESGTSSAQHQCSKCGRIFKVRKMLDKHQQIYHRDQSAVLRRTRHHPAMVVPRCCECDRHFSTIESYYRHQCFHLRKQLRAFHASGRKCKGVNFFHCQLCTLQFSEGLKFELHVKVAHPEQYKKAAKNKCSVEKVTKTRDSGVANNGNAFARPPSVTNAGIQITRVEPKVEDGCKQTGDTIGSCTVAANMEDQGTATSGPLHQCHKCGRIFKVRKMLDKHQRIYHQDQSAVLHRTRHYPAMIVPRCCECDRHFSTKESFYRHQCFHLRKQLRAFNASGSKCEGVNFFHCQLCALQFTKGLEFELHVKVAHPDQYKKAAQNKCSAGKLIKRENLEFDIMEKPFTHPPVS